MIDEKVKICQYYKNAFKEVLKDIAIPKKNLLILIEQGYNLENDPYNGHCAKATEAAYILFGIEIGYKPYKNKIKGRASHYWLANSEKGKEKEVCDLIVFNDNLAFDYLDRKGVSWISKKKTRDELSHEGKKIYDAVVKYLKKKENTSSDKRSEN